MKFQKINKLTNRKEVQNMKYELIVIWETGEKEIFEYATEEQAQEACNDFKYIFDNQVAWAGTRLKRHN